MRASRRTSSSPAPGPPSRSGTASAGRRTTTSSPPTSPTSPRVLAILLDMTHVHIPVLAGELIDVLGPQPGEVVIDCTIGGGGHARLVADRIGPAGTLIGLDRDPVAEERFAELAAEVA